MQIYQKYIKNRRLLSQNKKKGITPCPVTQVAVCSSSGKPQSCKYEPGLEGLINKAGKIKQGMEAKSRRKMKPQVFLLSVCGAGSIRAAIRRQRMDRAPRGKVWWLYGTTGRQTETEMQDRQSRRGRHLETQERGRESRGQKGEWLTIAHLCRHVNTDTRYRLSKCSVKFWIQVIFSFVKSLFV